MTSAPVGTDPADARQFRKPRVIRRTAAKFPVRKIGNSYNDATSHELIPDQPMVTNVLIGISMFFPPGERFMISAVRAVQDQITDPQLRADIDAFVHQESQHASEHGRANRFLAGSAGLNHEAVVREITALWNAIEKRCSPRLRVAVTAATEHFTAIISDVLIGDLDFVDAMRDGKVKQLLLWHAIEECEHKAVVFDAFQELGGSEFERIAVMALYTPPVFLAALCPIFRLIAAQGELTNLRGWWNAVKMVAAWTPAMVSRYFHYYRPGFHPNHMPTRHLELYWRERIGLIEDGQRSA
jgi:uncharacterized protein